jgi:hypothetical protein
MAQYREYQKPTVGQAGCTYSRLGNVYQGQMAGGAAAQNNYIVPKLCPNGPGPNYPPKYDTLSHGQAYQCGGYFGLSGAYPFADCQNCQADYVQRPCKANINCAANASVSEGYRGKPRPRGRTRGMF